ncbi:MAG: hypothetical protein L0Z62_50900 [Gemmataceae bacterium]|nr:hypothetical protein [Gemmataceae bacterium]
MFPLLKQLVRSSRAPGPVTGQPRASHRRSRRPLSARPACEALEDRNLLSLFRGEGQVNTREVRDQYASANASAANGRSVVVWTDEVSDSNTDIRAQIYDDSGSPDGVELVIAGDSRGEHSPAVAMDAHGNFAVAYVLRFSSTDQDIHARLYNRFGGYLGQVYVATGTSHEYDPSVAMAANGSFVVSYTYDAYDPQIYARRYNVNGVLLGHLYVATSTRAEQHSSVAMAPDGRSVIAYQKEYNYPDADIRLARYSASGSLLDHRSMDTSLRRDTNPSVSMDNAGNAVVAWQGNVAFGSDDWAIHARRVSSSGVLGNPLAVWDSINRDDLWPAVALDPTNGRFAVTFERRASDTRVLLVEVGADNVVPRSASDLGPDRWSPAISIDGNHFYQVTYTIDDSGWDPEQGIAMRFGSLDAASASLLLEESLRDTAFASLLLEESLHEAADGLTVFPGRRNR